jgi:hypothetical protein
MQGEGWLFIGILICIFAVWVATGGPSRPISWSGPYITPITTVGDRSEGYGISHASGSESTSHNTSRDLANAQDEVADLQRSVVSARQFGEASIYKDKVTIRHSVGSFSSDNPDDEYLTVSASSRIDAPIDISGWRVTSAATGKAVTIPTGVALVHSGAVNAQADIALGAGETAIISVGDSPIGVSFKENMCTGYFDQFQRFTPSLSQSCPIPSSDFDRFYLGSTQSFDACRAFVRTVGRCEVPREGVSSLGSECRAFIDKYFNYNGCVAAHAGDKDFYGRQWRIFLARSGDFFTETHDSIKLLDASGKTVDLLSY